MFHERSLRVGGGRFENPSDTENVIHVVRNGRDVAILHTDRRDGLRDHRSFISPEMRQTGCTSWTSQWHSADEAVNFPFSCLSLKDGIVGAFHTAVYK
jgi:hypothetical protein